MKTILKLLGGIQSNYWGGYIPPISPLFRHHWSPAFDHKLDVAKYVLLGDKLSTVSCSTSGIVVANKPYHVNHCNWLIVVVNILLKFYGAVMVSIKSEL